MPDNQSGVAPLTSSSRTLTAALCVALLLAFACALGRYTHGWRTWTFDGRRVLQLQAGRLRAPATVVRDASGRRRTLWPADGGREGVFLVDFVYTRCATVCRALGSEYQRMQARLREVGDPGAASRTGVRLLSISFDTRYDSTNRLARRASELGASPPTWNFVAPSTDQGSRALLSALGVVVIGDGMGGFVHNGAIHLLDRYGTLRGLYAPDQWREALAAATALAAAGQEAR